MSQDSFDLEVTQEHTVGRHWILDNIPMSPTVNQLYPVGRYGRKYRDSKGWDEKMELWTLERKPILDQMAKEIMNDLGGTDQKQLKIDMIFSLLPGTIWTQKGTFKKWDCDNRIKPMLDCLSGMLGIDDRAFIVGHTHRTYDKHNEMDYIIVRMSVVPILSTDEAIEEWVDAVKD